MYLLESLSICSLNIKNFVIYIKYLIYNIIGKSYTLTSKYLSRSFVSSLIIGKMHTILNLIVNFILVNIYYKYEQKTCL